MRGSRGQVAFALTIAALLAFGAASATHHVGTEEGPSVDVTPRQYGYPEDVGPVTLAFHVENPSGEDMARVMIGSPPGYDLDDDQPTPPPGYVRTTSTDERGRSWANFSAPGEAAGGGAAEETFHVRYDAMESHGWLEWFTVRTSTLLADTPDERDTVYPQLFLDGSDPVITRFQVPQAPQGWTNETEITIDKHVDDQCPAPTNWGHACPTFESLFVVGPDGAPSQSANVTDDTTVHLSEDPGIHTLYLASEDLAGNTAAGRSLEVGLDQQRPEAQLDLQGAAVDTDDEGTWYPDPVTAEASCSGEADDESGCAEARLRVGDRTLDGAQAELQDGRFTVEAHAEDRAGNTNTSSPVTFGVDTTDPRIEITEPRPGEVFGDGEIQVTVDASDQGDVSEVSTVCHIGTDDAPCGPFSSADLAHGDHTITARATDEAGNTAEDALTVTVDKLAPRLAIDRPSQGAVLDTETLTMNVSVEDPHLAQATCRLDEGASRPCASGTATFPDVPEGEHTLHLEAEDTVGNANATTIDVTVDRTAPDLTITAPDESLLADETVEVAAEADDAGALVQVACRLSVQDEWTPCGGDQAATFDVPEGALTIEARAVDAAGNEARAEHAIHVDRTPPTIDELTADHSTVLDPVEIGYAVSDDHDLAGGALSVNEARVHTFSAGDLTVTDTVSFEAEEPGTHRIGLQVADAAGNERQHALEVDIGPGPIAAYELDCPVETSGDATVTCTARGEDRLGFANHTPPGWTITEGELLSTDETSPDATEASFAVPDHGGTVEIRVHEPEPVAGQEQATAKTRVRVADGVGPSVSATQTGAAARDEPVPVAVDASDPGGLEEVWLTYEGHTLANATVEDDEIETVLEPVFRASGEFELTVHARDDAGNVAGEAFLVTVDEGEATSTSGSSSSSTSTDDTSTRETDETTRTAEPTTGGSYEAQVPVEDGRTPAVATTDGNLQVQIQTRAHDEVTVEMQPEAENPSPPPGVGLRSFDVSARTPEGEPATIDAARLDVVIENQAGVEGIEPDDVRLFHRTDGSWEPIEDATVTTTETGLRVQGTAPSLSLFAVALVDTVQDGHLVELTPGDDPDELPVTYAASIRVQEADSKLYARTSDGTATFSVDVSHTGRVSIELTIRQGPAEDMPEAVAETGRYVQTTLVDPEDRTHSLTVEDLRLRLDADDEPARLQQLVPLTAESDDWRALEPKLVRNEAGVTVASDDSRSMHAVVTDTQAPRIGLQEPIEGALAEARELDIVASDNVGVDRVRLVAEGAVVDVDEERPFTLAVNASALDAPSEVRMEAVDVAGNVGQANRTVEPADREPLEEAGLQEPGAEPEAETEQDTPTPGLLGLAVAAGVALAAHRQGRQGRR